MIKVSNLVKVIKSKNANAINALMQDRTQVNQAILDFLSVVGIKGLEIQKDDMGQATWYYVYYNEMPEGGRINLGSQFFWNEGSYNAHGQHSLYNEYGQALSQITI